jgi:hypothetical protein
MHDSRKLKISDIVRYLKCWSRLRVPPEKLSGCARRGYHRIGFCCKFT